VSFNQQYPNTFIGQVTNAVLKRLNNEFIYLYNLLTSLFGVSGHAHTGSGSDGAKISASDVINTPAGNIAAITLQAAINELDTEKVPLSTVTTAGDILYATAAATIARLGVTANAKLFGNAAGTAPEWATGIKLGSFTRDVSAASGTQSITGVGFKPSHVIFMVGINTLSSFVGVDNGTIRAYAGVYGPTQVVGETASLLLLDATAANGQSGLITTLDADGFTISWTKLGAMGASLKTISYLAWR
jgi:hypothetical protein